MRLSSAFLISMASRPPDREHPYGHSKFETFASLGIAVLLFASCIQIIIAATDRLLHPTVPDVTGLSFVIMIGTLRHKCGQCIIRIYHRQKIEEQHPGGKFHAHLQRCLCIRESSVVLRDKALIEESVISKLAVSVSGVCNCHRIRTRETPGQMYVDMHICVDSSLSLEDAHNVSEEVEVPIKVSIDGVEGVVVHIEPKNYNQRKDR